jgi:hypothetical protein
MGLVDLCICGALLTAPVFLFLGAALGKKMEGLVEWVFPNSATFLCVASGMWIGAVVWIGALVFLLRRMHP